MSENFTESVENVYLCGMKNEIANIIIELDFSSNGNRINIAVNKINALLEQQEEALYHLYSRPLEQLKPLEDLWRKENPREKFTIPDSTEFYKWIRLKILEK